MEAATIPRTVSTVGVSPAHVYPEFGSSTYEQVPVEVTPSPSVSADDMPGWVAPVLARVNELAYLRSGWDGFAGRPPDTRCVMRAVSFLGELMGQRPGIATPWIVPLPSGGIQVEWDRDDVEVELIFEHNGANKVVTADGGIEERPLTRDALVEIASLLAG